MSEMKRPAYDYAFGGSPNKRMSESNHIEQAMASVAWLADNFHYSNYEQAQKIAREVIDLLDQVARPEAGTRPEGSSDTKRLDWVLGLTPLLICKGRKVEPNRKAIDAELRAPQEQEGK